VVGSASTSAEPSVLHEYGQDLIEWESAAPPVFVVRATTTEHVVSILGVAARFSLALAPRGAGLSYTQGYVPEADGVIALDLSGLDRIEEINEHDLFVTAGAGATWQRINEALKPRGLRLAAAGPISGVHSTVGGAASQNVLGAMDAFTGLEVVLPDGVVIRTGAAANRRHPLAYYRNHGPDLTGLFLGDTGTFGIKTKVSLRLEPIPDGIAFASFSFPTLLAMVEVMTRVAREKLAPRGLGLDDFRSSSAINVGAKDAAKILGSVLRARSIGRSIVDAVSLVRGARGDLRDAKWSLHYVTEGLDQTCADKAMDAIRKICGKGAREMPPSIPVALHARPYSIRGFLGPGGERWIPIGGVFPLSRASFVVGELEAFFSHHDGMLTRSKIVWSVLAATEGPTVLVEPMFYWSDVLGPLHRRYLDRVRLERFDQSTADLDARQVVVTMRAALRDKFLEWGAVHGQIGKYYDFRAAVMPEYYETLTRIKTALDPECRLNPGNFGWRPSGQAR
jgi:D-lactate dehydrogenase (cytochrome)